MINLLGRLALAASLAASASAGAATYDLGALTEGVTSFGPYAVSASPDLFSDTFDFSIGKEENISVTAAPINNPPNMDISSISISLVGPGHVLLGGTGVGATSLWNAPGNYQIVINGFADGSVGGEYAGSIRISPVPEPGSTAMLLAGLGLLGYVVSRRKIGCGSNVLFRQ